MTYYKIMMSDEDGGVYEYVSVKDNTDLESKIQDFLSDFPKHSIEDVNHAFVHESFLQSYGLEDLISTSG